MARLSDPPESLAAHMRALPLPTFEDRPFAHGPAVSERRVALVSTAGLSRRDDDRFTLSDAGYRVLSAELGASDLVMSHISVNYDRTGFQEDVNVVFPIDRLHELADQGTIGSVAEYHYSFMGALDPEQMKPHAQALAGHLHADGVDAVILAPV